jgi:DNA-directed RNA polymerase specialized sigma24 family protein
MKHLYLVRSSPPQRHSSSAPAATFASVDRDASIELCRRLARREGAAVDGVIKGQGPRIHAVACHLLGDGNLAANITVLALHRVLEESESFAGNESFEIWVKRIVLGTVEDTLQNPQMRQVLTETRLAPQLEGFFEDMRRALAGPEK